jgi:hypothetical protein
VKGPQRSGSGIRQELPNGDVGRGGGGEGGTGVGQRYGVVQGDMGRRKRGDKGALDYSGRGLH